MLLLGRRLVVPVVVWVTGEVVDVPVTGLNGDAAEFPVVPLGTRKRTSKRRKSSNKTTNSDARVVANELS